MAFLGTGFQALGYGLLAAILTILIIPQGWAVSLLSGWYANNLAFSDGRTATFTGRGSQIWGYFILMFVLAILLAWIPVIGNIIYLLLSLRIQLAVVRWFFSHMQLSTGHNLRFEGDYWPFVGWYLLWFVSFITIIGWAWVSSGGMRWLCRNVDLGQEHLEFVGSGVEFLWRGIIALLGSILIITIPWLAVWYIRWITSNILILPGAAQQSWTDGSPLSSSPDASETPYS